MRSQSHFQWLVLVLIIGFCVFSSGCSYHHTVTKHRDESGQKLLKTLYRINKLALKKKPTLVIDGVAFKTESIYL